MEDQGPIYKNFTEKSSDETTNELNRLLTAQQNLKLLLDHTEESFLIADHELRIIMFNQAAARWAKEHIGKDIYIGMNILEIVNPERRNLLLEYYQAVLEGNSREYETEFLSANGLKFYMNTIKPAKNENGSIAGVIVITRDITDKKLVEQNIRKSELQYRQLFYRNPLPMWIFDAHSYRFLEVNDAATKHYGYSRKEFLSMTILEIRPEEDSENITKTYEGVEVETSFYKGNWRHKKKNGEIIIVEISSHKIDVDGYKAWLVLANDVTEKVNAEIKMQKTNERLFFASQATSDIIWDWNIKNGKILWSENFSKVMGYALPPDSTLTLEECYNKFHTDDKERVISSLNEVIINPDINKWENEFRYRKDDGSYAFVNDKGYIIRDFDGQAIRMIGAMQDISEQKYQQQLLALEKTILEMSAIPAISFKQVVNALLLGIEKLHPDMYSSVLILNPDNTVKHLSAPRLPKEYIQLIDGLKIGPETGSCGTSMYKKESVIISDLKSSKEWKQYSFAYAQFGLNACWSLPIINSNGMVMGSVAIYYMYSKQPEDKEWNTVQRIHNLLRLLMENDQSIQQIKISNERYDIVTKATHDLVWDWDLDTGELYRDPYGVREVYGVKENDSIKHINQWLIHIHPDDLQMVQYVINDILTAENKNTFDIEYRFQREDGTYSNIYDRGIIMRDENGKPYRMIGAAQNITERKRLEQSLLQQEVYRQKMISQAINDTQERERAEIGNELHDNVNQMLTTTKLYLDLAKGNPELKDEMIDKSTWSIQYIINEIRKISKALMVPSLGDLGLIDSITDLAENINETKKLQVELNTDEFDETLLADNQKLMFFRIVQEAINNVITHSEATLAQIGLKKQEDGIILTVRDNGKGFDPKQARKGIGLYNIQNRVSLFNGTLWINSSLGQGSELIVQIPFDKPEI